MSKKVAECNVWVWDVALPATATKLCGGGRGLPFELKSDLEVDPLELLLSQAHCGAREPPTKVDTGRKY